MSDPFQAIETVARRLPLLHITVDRRHLVADRRLLVQARSFRKDHHPIVKNNRNHNFMEKGQVLTFLLLVLGAMATIYHKIAGTFIKSADFAFL